MINTSIMNECLLTKWIWKIVKGSDETWFKVLQAKYMQNRSFLFFFYGYFSVLAKPT